MIFVVPLNPRLRRHALYALADEDDEWHQRTAAYLRHAGAQILVPITVLPEVCYLIDGNLGPRFELEFITSIVRREVTVEFLETTDIRRAAEIMERYGDLRLGFVDASVIAVAERLKIREVLTTDRRHFGAVRPRHCPAFDLKP